MSINLIRAPKHRTNLLYVAALGTVACAIGTLSTHASGAVIFQDTFGGGSTVNSASPAAPTATSASYQILSSKAWAPTPSVAAGDLKFGINSTSSGHIEAQAVFSNTPVALTNAGDYIELTMTFTDTAGILTANGILGFGMYSSGGVGPMAGGMNGTATSSTTISGGAQGWQGYDARVLFNNGTNTNKIATRPNESAITTAINQDLVTEGSGSQSYPGGTSLGSALSGVTLVAGNTYTEDLIFTLSAAGTYQITSALYDGVGTGGTQLYTQTVSATGGNFYNVGFDALAVGWRETGSQATTMDISSITVSTNVAVPEPTMAGAAALVVTAAAARRRRRSR